MATPTKPKSNMLQVTWHGQPVGRRVYADEILDMLAGWCPGMTSRKAKRAAGKLRRRDRLRVLRGYSPTTPPASVPEPPSPSTAVPASSPAGPGTTPKELARPMPPQGTPPTDEGRKAEHARWLPLHKRLARGADFQPTRTESRAPAELPSSRQMARLLLDD